MAGSEKRPPTGSPPPLEDFDIPDLDQLFTEEEPDTGVEQPAATKPRDPPPPVESDLPDLPDFVNEEPKPEPPPARAKKAAPEPPPPAAAAASEGDDFLSSQEHFRREARDLARARGWDRLAGLISAALDAAPWAASPEVKASLLFDLARVHRDRLRDLPSAEAAFHRLVELDPAHAEGIEFLSQRYQQAGDWQSLYLLTASAIEATWDPGARLEWTRKAVAVAAERLRSPELVVDAWERLRKLGDYPEEAASALSEAYRRGARWDRLAEFLRHQAEQANGAARMVALREVAEAYLSALRDQDQAAGVLKTVLAARPNDAVAQLGMARVFARRRDWESLEALCTAKVVPQGALIDLQRIIADALWSGEELERAARASDRILAQEPQDPEALRLKEEFLSKSGRTDELVGFLSSRAEACADVKERAALLARAATLAEHDLDAPRKAAELLELRAAIPAVRLEALRDLARLHATIGDHEGLRRALEGELELTRNPQGRIELLRRLAEHCAHRLGDDARAEACWRELLAAVPDDPTVRDELVALYRRRGDFASVDRMLSASAWRPLSDASLLDLWRAAAKNAQENLGDGALALRAWRRVLDLQPDDAEALQAAVEHQRALGGHDLIDAIERASFDERTQMTLEVAQLQETANDRSAALAAFERVLAWDARNSDALAGVIRLRPNGRTRAAIDAALLALGDDAAGRAALLEKALALIPADNALSRMFLLKRLLAVTGPTAEIMSRLAEAAGKAGAWEELAALQADVAARAKDPAERMKWSREVAAVYEHKLKDPLRAMLTLQAARQTEVTGLDELGELLRLAEATARPEDALALLEVAARASVPANVRREAMRRKIALLEKLKAAGRAFSECVRLLALDPRDQEALETARRLAASAGLWPYLDALYDELRDRANNDEERLQLTLERQRIRLEQLKDPAAALDELLLALRLGGADAERSEAGIGEKVLEAARAEKAWDDVLPILEGRLLSRPQPAADDIAKLAKLQHGERKDPRRAFELYRLAFERQPHSDLGAVLGELAEATGRYDAWGETLRSAAARAGGSPRALELYRAAAALFAGRAKRPDLALDMHQRILQLESTDLKSLAVVIEHQRASGLWRELRDSLQRWIELSPDHSTENLLEIASLSRTQLSDPETALATYARVLAADPGNAPALDGIRALTEGPIDATLQLRRLRVELGQATGADRQRLLLQCAELQERELDDAGGALATLQTLVGETGKNGPGAAPLIALLTRQGAWLEVVETMTAQAAAMDDAPARLRTLEEALHITDSRQVPPAVREQLCRKILAENPKDRATASRLLVLLRNEGRHADAAALLEQLLATWPDERDFEDELVRLHANALDKLDVAQARAQKSEDTAWLATLLWRRGDRAGCAVIREQQARASHASLGALILCHLAETRDEAGADPAKVIELYRAAREIDPACAPAMDALKALGRRTRNWRESAALLPDGDSRKLQPEERGARLRDRGDACRAADGAVAISWYERAVAVAPDDYLAWEALSDLYRDRGDGELALEARRASLAAYERSAKPEPAQLEEHARRIQSLAELEDNTEEASRLMRRAHELVPSLAGAALAVADELDAAGESAQSLSVYDRLLAHPDKLTNDERLRARYGRGRLRAQEEQLDAAIEDLRDGLRLSSLHSGLLQALADVLLRKGRFAAAVQHYTTALLLAHEPLQRAALYARIGLLWEERLENPEEAGACYDLSITAGSDDQDVMARALGHYRRTNQGERALSVIERLLPITSDPRTLAMLWSERGRIYATSDSDKAMEAFDLALSYDPACQPAVSGLAALLEQRGDWKQLVDLLEVRAETGSLESRAEALRSLARISREHLKDNARAGRLLREAARLAPRKKDFTDLLALYGDDPARAGERREATAGLMRISGPWMAHLAEIGRALAAEGHRRWAWSVLSPFMSTTMPDAATKALVLELRKEFEKGDNVEGLTPADADAVRHADLTPELWQVLVELDRAWAAPAAVVEGSTRLDARTAVGKTFAALAERLGMAEAALYRAPELPTASRLAGDHVVVRGDLLPLLSPNEISFWFASLITNARPGARLLLSLPPDDAKQLLQALFVAAGVAEGPTSALVAEIRARAGAQLAGWRDKLAPSASLPPERILDALHESALRVALLAVPDLRVALKLLGRVDEEMAKMPSAGRVEDIDEVFASSPAARGLASFAISAQLGERIG